MATKVPIGSVKARVQAAQAALELASLTVMFPEVRQAVNVARVELRAAMTHMKAR
jgi:hypothetical protein